MSASDDPLWTYAVALYGRPGVAAECLRLQDAFGVDVVVLLAALFAQGQGRAFDDREIAAADRLVRPWRGDVVHPLRQVRRRLKEQRQGRLADVAEELRQSVKRAELDAEKLEFALLRGWLATLQPGGKEPSAEACVTMSVRFYAGRALSSDEERALRESAAAIAAAAEPLGGSVMRSTR